MISYDSDLLYFPQRAFDFINSEPWTADSTYKNVPIESLDFTDLHPAGNLGSTCIVINNSNQNNIDNNNKNQNQNRNIISTENKNYSLNKNELKNDDDIIIAINPNNSTSSSNTMINSTTLSIIVDQCISLVGTTVWDAEVILAYYLNSLSEKLIGNRKCKSS